MKIVGSFLYLFLSVLVFISCAHKEKQIPRQIASLQANDGMEGIWFLQGSSSTRGPYNGEIELRKAQDGTFNVVRVVTYINYFFDGLKVQEVWTGKAISENEMLTVSYDLKQGDFITRLNGQKRDSGDFKNSVTVISRFSLSEAGLVAKFSDKKVSDYSEWLTTKRNLEATPLWVDQRTNYEAKGGAVPANVRQEIKKYKIASAFDKNPWLKTYKDKIEFKNEKPFIVLDPTDYQFYQSEKDTIRVANKITDDISITEAVVKRNAYVPTLPEKAVGYDNNTRSSHFNEANLVVATTTDPVSKAVSYAHDSHAALSTGMYLASQAMRYKTTQAPEALENVRRSLKGILLLLEISNDSSVVANSIAVKAPGNTSDNPEGWYSGTGKHQNFIWSVGADKEAFTAIVHGLLWAKTVLPSTDVELWRDLNKGIIDLPNKEFVNVKPEDKAIAHGLASTITKDSESLDIYIKTIPKENNFYWNGTADWKNSSLSMIDKANQVMVAELLGQSQLASQWREKIMEDWVIFEPARRHLSTMIAYGFAYRQGIRGKSFQASSNDEKFNQALSQSVWGLREIPYPRPNIQVAIDHSLKSEWSVSPIPGNFWNLPNKRKATPPAFQGLYQYPAFELQAFSSGFLWTDPAFAYHAEIKKVVENTGVDYLYAYWLARYVGVENVM